MCRITSETSDSLASSERNVSFSTIEFNEHAMILGCSPATTSGPPLEIDWEKMSTATFALDEYEELRPPRRVKQQLLMPVFLREEVLLESGYSRNQINDHLQRLKEERRSYGRSSLTLPIKLLGKARRSLLGSRNSSSQSY